MAMSASELLNYISAVKDGVSVDDESLRAAGLTDGGSFLSPSFENLSGHSSGISLAEDTFFSHGPVRSSGQGSEGIYHDIDDAIEAAWRAQKKLVMFSLEDRGRFVDAMRRAVRSCARRLSEMAHEETGYGHVNDKIAKNLLAADKTPGIEDLYTIARTGDEGMMLTEMAPFGVIGSITPSTNPTATIINNSIGMVAAGNAVVFNPHPAAKACCIETIRILNRAVAQEGGPDSLLCCAADPDMKTSAVIMSHPKVRLLVVTGGEAVVNIAMRSGKRTIGAGPGNPPVVVDETADIARAASDIVKGVSFENDMLCLAEKEILCVNSVADALIGHLRDNGAYLLDQRELEKVLSKVLIEKDGKYSPNKAFVGKDASYILSECGIRGASDAKMLLAQTPFEHPLVMTEMLMPVIPLTRFRYVDEAIEAAFTAEQGCHHSAHMHSENVSNLTKMAKLMDTTIFVKNAPSYAGLGFGGEGYATLTIATPTGEGLTSARNFTRSRRCVMHGAFRIV